MPETQSADALVDSVTDVDVDVPDVLAFLLEGHRYKVAYGGRGGLKSWTFARALLTLGAHKPLRILCTREVQRTIKDSVHKLLSDQIALLNMGRFYSITQSEISGQNGTAFIFTGLSDQTAESIKSYEGIDICWVEEAQKVRKRSWGILVPTIRKAGSEIWISFNPELDTDETYVRFVLTPPPGAVVVKTTYRDNPWFTAELEGERLHDSIVLPLAEYEWIWEGKCLPAVAGAIYAREVADMVTQGRIVNCPYDPRLRVHTVWDLGWNDRMVVGFWQRGFADVRLIDYIEVQFKRVDEVVGMYADRNWNWGYDWLPFDGFSHDAKSGTTVAKILQKFGRKVQPVPNLSEELGIKHTRQFLTKVYVDREKGKRFLECLKRFRRYMPKHGEPAHPVDDEFAHGADMGRYTALVAERMTNANEDRSYPVIDPFKPRIGSCGHLG
jgi:phage terminase large subunit